MAAPTKSEVFSILIEHLRKSQEACSTLAHLCNEDGTPKGQRLAIGWLGVENMFKLSQHTIIELAKRSI